MSAAQVITSSDGGAYGEALPCFRTGNEDRPDVAVAVDDVDYAVRTSPQTTRERSNLLFRVESLPERVALHQSRPAVGIAGMHWVDPASVLVLADESDAATYISAPPCVSPSAINLPVAATWATCHHREANSAPPVRGFCVDAYLGAYQMRWSWSSRLSNSTVMCPHGSWPTGCCPVADRGHGGAHFRLLRDRPRSIWGNADRRSAASMT